jgi:hypothetical protein
MPYKIFGNCVHKVNADGSKGEVVKCHDNKEQALDHMRALWANVHDSAIAEFSMAIIKATSKDGQMTWRSTNSDVEEDYFGERMSKELFADFNKHIENNEPIPEVFKGAICEEDWCGGMPYVSIAHYKTGRNKVNVPGEVKSIYIDGEALKSTGLLYDTPLGNAIYKSLKKDLVEKSGKPIRISIGFLDLEHSHGDKYTFTRKSLTDKCPLCKEGIGDKIYKKGHLVHLALTREPANPRTGMELEQKSMNTKIQDAESVIEDEEVIKTLDLKSMAEDVQDVLVIKAKEPDDESKETQVDDETPTKKKKPVEVEKSIENTVVSPVASSERITEPVKELSAVEKSTAALLEKVSILKSQGSNGDAALAEIQKSFDELGNVVKAEFTVPPSPEETARKNMEVTLRSLLGEMLPQALAQVVAPLQSELGELRALSQARPVIKKEETPLPRNLNYNLVQKSAIEALVAKTKPKDQFQAIADQSVGLQQ